MSTVGRDRSSVEVQKDSLTFQGLVDICNKHPEKIVRFCNTDYSPKSIESWRGAYNLPSMDYTKRLKTGLQVATNIITEIGMVHTAWKGGEYEYKLSEEFYISEFGRCEEHKIYGYEVVENEVLLLTEYDPY